MQPRHHRVDEPVVLHARVVTGTGGGPEKTILNSPRYLSQFGYRGTCAYMHPTRDPGFEQIRQKAELWDAPLFSIHDNGPLSWNVIPDALTLCRRLRVAIWHGHDYKSNLLGLLLHRFWKMKLITTVHGWVKHTSRTPLYYKIDRFCLPRYEMVVAVSEDLYETSLQTGVQPLKCHLIENGIDTTEFRRQASLPERKRELGLNANRLVIGACGRLSPEKGFDLLIRACSQLLKEGKDLELVILGEGDQESSLRALSEQLGCRDRVHLYGYRSDVRPVYEAMDVFVLSSLREGLPNVLLEAQALQTPVISTRIAGVPRLIQNNENGILIEPGSVDELVSSLRTLLSDSEMRTAFAAKGRAVIEERYSFERRMRKMADLYDELLERK